MDSRNHRLMNPSPRGYAVIWASVMAFGNVSGRVLYGWAAGDIRLLEVLLTGGLIWFVIFPAARLTAPAALQAARQHQLWREERRQHSQRP